jgi:hypothetical protein
MTILNPISHRRRRSSGKACTSMAASSLLRAVSSTTMIVVFLLVLLACPFGFATAQQQQHSLSVAQQWNKALLKAIRMDLARPPVHARNLFHLSAVLHSSCINDLIDESFLGKCDRVCFFILDKFDARNSANELSRVISNPFACRLFRSLSTSLGFLTASPASLT